MSQDYLTPTEEPDEEYNKRGYQDSEDSDAPTGAAWNAEDE